MAEFYPILRGGVLAKGGVEEVGNKGSQRKFARRVLDGIRQDSGGK
jgi:hypothetical protein